MFATNDSEIRKAFHRKKLKQHHSDKNTLVIDELGLVHGANRIDIAVVNGCIHGYEIKSSRDSLDRLCDQLSVYAQALQKLTIVSAPNHLDDVIKLSPEWVGVIETYKGSQGAVHFKTIRKAKGNPNLDPIKVAHLLWKNETITLLEELGVPTKQRKGTRKELYKVLVDKMSTKQLIKTIKVTFESRPNWRSVIQPE